MFSSTTSVPGRSAGSASKARTTSADSGAAGSHRSEHERIDGADATTPQGKLLRLRARHHARLMHDRSVGEVDELRRRFGIRLRYPQLCSYGDEVPHLGE